MRPLIAEMKREDVMEAVEFWLNAKVFREETARKVEGFEPKQSDSRGGYSGTIPQTYLVTLAPPPTLVDGAS